MRNPSTPWLRGLLAVAVWVVVTVGVDVLAGHGVTRAAMLRGLFGGVAFATVWLGVERFRRREA